MELLRYLALAVVELELHMEPLDELVALGLLIFSWINVRKNLKKTCTDFENKKLFSSSYKAIYHYIETEVQPARIKNENIIIIALTKIRY